MMGIKIKGSKDGRFFLKGGSGGLNVIGPSGPPPVVYPTAAYNNFQAALMKDGSVGPKIVFYGGAFGYSEFSPPINWYTGGYVYDVDTTSWVPGLEFAGPSEDEGLGRFLGLGVPTTTTDKVMMLGGASATTTFDSIVLHSGSVVYDAGSDTWGSAAELPNYAGALFQPSAATDPVDGKVFVMSKVLTLPIAINWIDQLSVCENPTDPTPTWVAVETATPLDLTNAYTDGFGVLMNARHVGSYTQVLVVTSSNSSTPRGDTLGVFLWDQTQTGPVSGSWTFITGSDTIGGMGAGPGYGDANALPRPLGDEYVQFWDDSKSRWTFIDNSYHAGLGLWWTWDGASTWDSGSFDRSGFIPPGCDPLHTKFQALVPDPDNSCVYGTIIGSGSGGSNYTWVNNSVWFLNLPTDLSTAAWTNLSG